MDSENGAKWAQASTSILPLLLMGQICPATITLTARTGHSCTIHQLRAVQGEAIGSRVRERGGHDK